MLGVDAFRGTLLAGGEHQHELALLPVGLSQPIRRIAEGHARHFLEFLAQFAREDNLALRTEARQQVLQRLAHAVRRLVEHQRPGHVERLERLAPRAALRGQEAGEEKAAGGEARGRNRRGGGARAGQRAHADARRMRLRHEPGAGIGERWRPRVAYQRDILARTQRVEQRLRGAALVVLVQRHGARADAVMREQRAAGARVLAGDEVRAAQRLDRARARVGEIADRRSHDE